MPFFVQHSFIERTFSPKTRSSQNQLHPKRVHPKYTFIQNRFIQGTLSSHETKIFDVTPCHFGHPPHTSAGCQHVNETVPPVSAMDTKADAADIIVAGRAAEEDPIANGDIAHIKVHREHLTHGRDHRLPPQRVVAWAAVALVREVLVHLAVGVCGLFDGRQRHVIRDEIVDILRQHIFNSKRSRRADRQRCGAGSS